MCTISGDASIERINVEEALSWAGARVSGEQGRMSEAIEPCFDVSEFLIRPPLEPWWRGTQHQVGANMYFCASEIKYEKYTE